MRTTRGHKRRWRVAIGGLLAFALIAGACGDGDDTGTSTTAEAPTTTAVPTTTSGDGATTTTAAATTTTPPAEPQTFIIAVPAVPGNVNQNAYQGEQSNDTYPVWEGTLIRYKRIDDQNRLQGPDDVESEIAESWVVNDDGSITFTLRDAMSPFGNTVTSEDVRWSFERMKEFDPITRFLFAVGSFNSDNLITVIDDKTFTVNVTQPNILTLRTLAWYGTSIIDSVEALSHATDDDPWAKEWLDKNTATFGPYYTTDSDFVGGESIRLTANPNYFRGKAFFDTVLIRAIPESSSRLQLISNGDIQNAESLSLSDFAAAEADPGVTAIRAPVANHDIIYLNHGIEAFADPRVREAISLAIDREALVQGAYQGVGKVAISYFDTDLPGPKLPEEEWLRQDLDRARQLLAEAGYGDGLSFTLVAHSGRPGPQAEPLAVLIKDQLAAIGVDVEINVVAGSADFNAGRALQDGGPAAFEAWLDTASPIVPDMAYHTALTFASGPLSINNRMLYRNDQVDALLAEALSLPEGSERDAVLLDLQRELQTTTPFIALVETINNVAFSNDIEGYYTVATNRIYPHLFSSSG